jgi:SAM-dependent methyltransferase
MHEDLEVVRGYFSQWSAYQRAVDCNCMHHHEAFAAMRLELSARPAIGALLDLGCGDAAPIPDLVAALGMTSYTGIDVTRQAIDLAPRNLAGQQVPCDFTLADFTTELPRLTEAFDTILASLSMHDLPRHDKPAFFAAAHRRLAAGGVLLCYEPTNRPGESRHDYIARQSRYFAYHFTRMTAEQVALLNQHVADADHPESPGGYAGAAVAAGFTGVRVLYVDPQPFWAALAYFA